MNKETIKLIEILILGAITLYIGITLPVKTFGDFLVYWKQSILLFICLIALVILSLYPEEYKDTQEDTQLNNNGGLTNE